MGKKKNTTVSKKVSFLKTRVHRPLAGSCSLLCKNIAKSLSQQLWKACRLFYTAVGPGLVSPMFTRLHCDDSLHLTGNAALFFTKRNLDDFENYFIDHTSYDLYEQIEDLRAHRKTDASIRNKLEELLQILDGFPDENAIEVIDHYIDIPGLSADKKKDFVSFNRILNTLEIPYTERREAVFQQISKRVIASANRSRSRERRLYRLKAKKVSKAKVVKLKRAIKKKKKSSKKARRK